MKADLWGALLAAFLLIELWANLNPIRLRLGLPEFPSTAVHSEPSRSAQHQKAAKDQDNAEIGLSSVPADPSSEQAKRDADDGKSLDWPAWIQAVSAVTTVVATIFLVRITNRQARLAESQIGISQLQTAIAERQATLMASQNDLSFITQRAWVRVVVKVSGPIKIIGGELSGFFRLEFTNSGALPANVDRTCNAAYPWNMNPATSDEPRVSYIINSYKSTPLTRRSVIFPQQTVEEALQASIWLPGKEITNNMAMGFVLVLRGAIRYDYPGNTQVHYTTFHVHVMRALDPAAVSPLHTIPTDDGVVIPASEIFIANQAGETEAT